MIPVLQPWMQTCSPSVDEQTGAVRCGEPASPQVRSAPNEGGSRASQHYQASNEPGQGRCRRSGHVLTGIFGFAPRKPSETWNMCLTERPRTLGAGRFDRRLRCYVSDAIAGRASDRRRCPFPFLSVRNSPEATRGLDTQGTDGGALRRSRRPLTRKPSETVSGTPSSLSGHVPIAGKVTDCGTSGCPQPFSSFPKHVPDGRDEAMANSFPPGERWTLEMWSADWVVLYDWLATVDFAAIPVEHKSAEAGAHGLAEQHGLQPLRRRLGVS